MNTNTASPDALPETMIEKVKEMGYAQRPEVERVLRDVPRHEFVPEYAPYDRIIATVSPCGFVYLVGEDEGELAAPITDDQAITLHWDRDQAVDPDAVRGILDKPRTAEWSGVTIAGDEPHDGVWLRLTVTDPRVCRINAPADTPPEVCDPVQAYRSPVLVDGDSLAYLTSRRRENGDQVRWELGAIGHGPLADELAGHLCSEVRAWSVERDHRKPKLIAYPAGTPDSELEGTPIDKNHSRLVLTYDDNA